MVHFAKRVRSIESSPTVHIGDLIAEMKARGEKVLSLAIGEPDFPTPAHIVQAADAVAEAITPHTRLLMLNSPSNPAGSVYSRAETKALADLAADHDLILVSDEIYEKILYEGEHISPASLDGMFDRTVTVNG